MAEEVIFNKEQLDEVENKAEIQPLDDMYMIEDVVMRVKELKKKIDFYRDYKKKKVSDIDKEITNLIDRVSFFKKVVLKTLEENKEKSVSFPGSCKVVSRKPKDRWVIIDEESFIEMLKDENEIDNVAEKLIQYKLIKKEVDKLLNTWEKSGKIEESDCVEKEKTDTTISITYLEEEKIEESVNRDAKVDYDKL